MNKFKKLEESICNLVTEFEQIDESCEPSLNSHFIKARNLCFEIHQHSSKVLQLAKVCLSLFCFVKSCFFFQMIYLPFI